VQQTLTQPNIDVQNARMTDVAVNANITVKIVEIFATASQSFKPNYRS